MQAVSLRQVDADTSQCLQCALILDELRHVRYSNDLPPRLIASTIEKSVRLRVISRTNEPSILRKSGAISLRYRKDDNPEPKSSSATWQPSDRTGLINRIGI